MTGKAQGVDSGLRRNDGENWNDGGKLQGVDSGLRRNDGDKGGGESGKRRAVLQLGELNRLRNLTSPGTCLFPELIHPPI